MTRNGRALDILMTRLVGAINSTNAGWEKDKALQSVSQRMTALVLTELTDATGHASPEHD